ncbi:hypothetical protein GCM10009799_27690 [Nocardiopsis rhodophaea]|uniref:Uncharacterized protein n=1 Tax=Nocardiopsis rhodophaea TaxID=280238 RepID=A0ABN2T777_9ACTN
MTNPILPPTTRRQRPRSTTRTRPYLPVLRPARPLSRPARSARAVRHYAMVAWNRQRMGLAPTPVTHAPRLAYDLLAAEAGAER